jgi:hypothetical protein
MNCIYETERGKRDGIFMCIDIHAFACRPGHYLLGNALPAHQMVENITFAKILSEISRNFNFEACNFPGMKKHKKKESHSSDLRALDACGGMSLDSLSKELKLWSAIKDRENSGFKSSKSGTGRVALFKQFGIIHSYTVECSCNPIVEVSMSNYEKNLEEMRKISLSVAEPHPLGEKLSKSFLDFNVFLINLFSKIKYVFPACFGSLTSHQFRRDDNVHNHYGR